KDERLIGVGKAFDRARWTPRRVGVAIAHLLWNLVRRARVVRYARRRARLRIRLRLRGIDDGARLVADARDLLDADRVPLHLAAEGVDIADLGRAWVAVGRERVARQTLVVPAASAVAYRLLVEARSARVDGDALEIAVLRGVLASSRSDARAPVV